MLRLPWARRPEAFAVVHLYPVVALALSVHVHTKLIREAKLNHVVGRGLEYKIYNILFYLVSSLIPLNKLHGKNVYISLLIFDGITLAKKQCRLDIRTFSQRTINEWNRLSADCVGANSVNMFKNKIDMYLRRAGYI